MQQSDTPNTHPKKRNATPPKLSVRSNDSSKSRSPNGKDHGYNECNGAAEEPSRLSSPTRSNSRSRTRGSRKNRSKHQIASENQQLAGDEDQLEIKREQQLRDAEKVLCGHEDLPDSEFSGEYDPSDESGAEDGDAGYHAQGREVRDQVLQERQQRKPQRQRQRPQDGSDTGVRAFNVRRADPDKRPMGVKLKRKDNSSSHDNPHAESQNSQPPSHEQDERQSRPQIPRIPGLSQAQGTEQSQEQGRSQSTEQGGSSSNDGKDVSIKFDLNMEIEILVKAKIKGEIMVTFM